MVAHSSSSYATHKYVFFAQLSVKLSLDED